MLRPLPPIYPIVDVKDSSTEERDRAIALASSLVNAGAKLLQLRAKSLASGTFVELATEMDRITTRAGAELIINDRVDIAAASAAAGVHLGLDDLPAIHARRLLGPDKRIGASTHCMDDVLAVDIDCNDYLGFGPIYESPTKAGVRSARGLEPLESAAAASKLPVVAIGGVTLESALECWRRGAASVAIISDFERATDPGKRFREYSAASRDCDRVNGRIR